MNTQKSLIKVSAAAVASCSLFYGSFAAAATETPPAPAAASSPAKALPPSEVPPTYLGGIRPKTKEDSRIENKERATQRAERSKGITALAKKDLAAKRYKDVLAKTKLALELNPKNKEAARIRKKAESLAGE